VSALEHFLQQLRARLEAGAREYGDKSLVRSVAAIVNELDQELLDLPGWSYILWCQAYRKAAGVQDQPTMRAQFLDAIAARIERNDRGRNKDAFSGALGAMSLLEVLCIDFYEHRRHVLDRLQPIARMIEVAQAMDPYRGRHGGTRNPRSDD
jgi:hypothetical protein